MRRRAQSQAFRPISPKPCKSEYFKSDKTLVLLRASAFFTGDYLTGTPLGADYVQGTQGRYFLPLLPLVLLALMPANPLRGARLLCAGAGLALLIIAMLSAWDSFWVHGFVTADGMPPHSSITRALLRPSPRW